MACNLLNHDFNQNIRIQNRILIESYQIAVKILVKYEYKNSEHLKSLPRLRPGLSSSVVILDITAISWEENKCGENIKADANTNQNLR